MGGKTAPKMPMTGDHHAPNGQSNYISSNGDISKAVPVQVFETQNGESPIDSSRSDSASKETPRSAPPAIAIIGIGLRLPSGIHTTDAFWDLLVEKRETRCLVPDTRYNVNGFYNQSMKTGSVATKYGHFLAESDKLDSLDTSFFPMSRAEAEQLDPQQRMVLEVVWECMENGGQVGWRGSNIGVFLGTFNEDWHDLLAKDPQSSGLYKIVSSDDFVVANRISYDYDLKGPSFTIKTACSSAMIGVHEACQAIHNGDCDSAIIAGTNLIITPTMTMTMSEQGILSPEGRSKTFDATADGYGRGEAINAIYIKKLSDAIANNDPIRGIIRGTAVNADGKTSGITMPSTDAHERLIRRAYDVAQIKDLSQTAFFECHGTGTAVGDPLEVNAVARVFGGDKGIYIGSVKANVGHSEASSGLTSIIKSVLALENKTILPNIHFSQPNPKIPFKEANLRVPVETLPWPTNQCERISVNSFGIAGSNAHVIVDSASSFGIRPTTHGVCHTSHLLVFSANSAESLSKSVAEIKNYISINPSRLNDLAYTLNLRREHLPYRSFAITNTNNFFESSLGVNSKSSPHITFVFTGQGAQWATMGKELIQNFTSFDKDIRDMSNIISRLPGHSSWDLREELLKDELESNLSKAELSQPLCTALQLAIVNLLRRFNIFPAGVVGHSSGEIAAAYAARALTLEDAILIAYYRGQSTKANKQKGAMAAVGMGRTEINLYLKRGVVIGCENSPSSVTLSGDARQLDDILEELKLDEPDVFARRLKVEMAYHSYHMKSLGGGYEALLEPTISSMAPTVPLFSTVTGKLVTDKGSLGASYWRQNLESPVLFHSAIKACLDAGPKDHLFVEVGPHSALAGPLRQIFKDRELTVPNSSLTYLPTLVRGKDCNESLLKTIGQLHLQSFPVNFQVLTPTGNVLTNLPNYQWRHDTVYWNEGRLTRDWRFRKFGRHELLGCRTLECSDIEPSWRNILRLEEVPWLVDHKIIGDVVFPCAGYVGMVGEAMRQLSGTKDYSIRRLTLKSALVLFDSKSVEIITSLRPVGDSEWYEFTISSYSNSTWTKHCHGQSRAGQEIECQPNEIADYVRKVPFPYQILGSVGLNYGPAFQGLTEVSTLPGKTSAVATLVETIQPQTYYTLHPTAIDHCLQLIAIAMSDGIERHMTKLCVPTGIDQLYVGVNDQNESMKAKAISCVIAPGTSTGNSVLLAGNKTLLSLIGGRLSPIDTEVTQDPHRAGAAQLEWAPDIDFLNLESLIRGVRRAPGSLDAVHKLTLLTAVEINSQAPTMKITIPHLQKFRSFFEDYVNQALNGKLLHFANWDIEALISVEAGDRRGLIDKTISEIAGTDFAVVGELISRVLHNCRAILEGTTKAIEVLMLGDALTNVYNLLGSMTDISDFFRVASHSNPNLRILEIGAGTGGTTAIALANMISSYREPMYSKYSYTDVSPGFFPAAIQRFGNYQNVKYQILDITKDPIDQGFEEGAYDLVIAANVLHATPKLSTTLRNVRKLLQPNGRLFLQELNPGSAQFVDAIMGGLRDWWLGEADDRIDRPYINVERWDHELRESGFAGVEGAVYDSSPPNVLSNIVARPWPPNDDEYLRVTLLCDANAMSPLVNTVEQLLTAQGYAVHRRSLQDELPAHQDIISLLDLGTSTFETISAADFQSFMGLLTKLGPSGVLWVTKSSQMGCEDPNHGLILGLARTIRSEMAIPFATLEVDSTDTTACNAIVKVFRKFQSREIDSVFDTEGEYALSNSLVHVPRYHWISLDRELSRPPTERLSFRMDFGRNASLQSLQWVSHVLENPDRDSVIVDMHFVGLNRQDLNIVFRHNRELSKGFGIEGSGVIKEIGDDVCGLEIGDRVMVYGQGLLSTSISTSAKRCVKIPHDLSLEAAASMPFAFTTAFHGLVKMGRLQKGESVLIQPAMDGVGLASIQICQMIGAKIFATVDSDEQAQYLVDMFSIPRKNIFHSHVASFYADVMRETNDRGFDLVFSSELLHKSRQCIAEYGRLVNIANGEVFGHDNFLLEANRSLISVDTTQFSPERVHELLVEIITLLSESKIKPIHPTKVFEHSSVPDAFVEMRERHRIGECIVRIPRDLRNLPTAPMAANMGLRSDVSYLLVGGLGALGKAFSTWMVESGARHLVFLSRSAGRTEEHQAFIEELSSQGCKVEVFTGDVTKLGDVRRVIECASKPIAGVIQLAMVLNDSLVSNMTHSQWEETLAPKVQGAWNLHHATANLSLDFFILLSSISAVIGTRGQGNYAAANTFLGAFVQYRLQQGLPAYVIDVGTTSRIGLIGTNDIVEKTLQSQSYYFITEKEVLAGLQLAMVQSSARNPFAHKNHLTLGLRSTRPLSDPSNRIPWKRDVRMKVARNLEANTATSVEQSKNRELETLLSSIESDITLLNATQTFEILTRIIGERVYTLMLRSLDEIDVLQSLEGLGVDSLVTIEIRNWWKRTLGLEASTLEILNASTIQGLVELAIAGLDVKFNLRRE